METTFRINQTSRQLLMVYLDNYTLEQLNKIPEGFGNNLLWNIGHILVTQQILIYKFSGLPMCFSDEFIARYVNGSKPNLDFSKEDFELIKASLFATANQLKQDFKAGVFKTYQEFTTKSSGFLMTSAQQAIEFNNFHESMHLGIMMQMKKFI